MSQENISRIHAISSETPSVEERWYAGSVLATGRGIQASHSQSVKRSIAWLTSMSPGKSLDPKKLASYVDMHQSLTTMTYTPGDTRKFQFLRQYVAVLGLLLFISAIIVLDYFIFWKPQEDEADEDLQNVREKLVSPTIIVLTIFSKYLRLFDESHKHGVKRLVLFLLVPCKLFVALAALDNNEVGDFFQWCLLACGLLACNCVIYGAIIAAIVRVGLVEKKSSWGLWIEMFIVATALTGYPFGEDISPKCFTTMVFLDIPNKFNSLVLAGIFLFTKYTGELSIQNTAWNFLTNINILAMILGLFVCISGAETSFEENVAYSMFNRAVVAIANCLRPLTMVFIGLNLKPISLENIAQVACVFLRRSSWIVAGLYFHLAPSDMDNETLLAVLLFVNSTCSLYGFMHLDCTANYLQQKIENWKGNGISSEGWMPLRLQEVNNVIGCIMPLIFYDFGFTIALNILISINKEWFANGTNVILSGMVFTIIGAGIVAFGVYLGRSKQETYYDPKKDKVEMIDENNYEEPDLLDNRRATVSPLN